MHAVFVQFPKEFRDKVRLQQRFAARDGHAAAIAPVGLVAQHAAHQFVRVDLLAAVRVPCIRIVAIHAAQRAALHKDYAAHTRPVHRAQGLDGMDASGHFATTFLLMCLLR